MGLLFLNPPFNLAAIQKSAAKVESSVTFLKFLTVKLEHVNYVLTLSVSFLILRKPEKNASTGVARTIVRQTRVVLTNVQESLKPVGNWNKG